ncbi:hypothetical protein [Cognatishimia sp. MH4019]|uniref:hypothetical protein n=1 Tax=Cognatishimia sp. MH4019 TaxID=2854030 RepID=UPI001CD23093|nr:hypothetical protein [Cognatishimia sp. MH4019]
MNNQPDDLIAPRAPPKRPWRWVFLILCVAMVFSAYLIFVHRQSSTLSEMLEDGVRLSALDDHFALFDTSWRQVGSKYELSGAVIVFAKSRTETYYSINATFLRALCGSVLTAIIQMPEAPTERGDVFQLILWFPAFEDGEPTGEIWGGQRFKLPLTNGVCPTLQDLNDLVLMPVFEA